LQDILKTESKRIPCSF